MLIMTLVVAMMVLLIGGSLYGLASYRSVMGTYQSKLEELSSAVILKAGIAKLKQPPRIPAQQADEISERVQEALKFLSVYQAKLNDTIGRGRGDGEKEQLYAKALQKDLETVSQALKDEARPKATVGRRPDLLDTDSAVRVKMDDAERNVNDLIDGIMVELEHSFESTKAQARLSIIFVSCTGVFAVLLMFGLLRTFYRAVGQPLRQLELGVSRVAKGDFQYRIDIKSGDEIEDLARAYNQMADKLGAIYDNLAQQVNERSRQLVRSERLAGVGFLAAGVAHEINNPLAAILFSSEALESRLSELLLRIPLASQDRETIAKYLKMIQEEAFRCKEITQKLLAFSRGGELKREPTNLVDIMQGVLDMVQHLQNSKGKSIDFRPIVPMLAWVHAQEIKQVFLNLVVNALESMEDGGVLTISQQFGAGQVELIFKDTGCGMESEVLENIFEPFYTRSRTGKGTGLGLSISHRIITQHGGEIEATSAGPGKGSTFAVRLPIDPPANAAEPGQDVQDPVEEFLKLSSAKRAA
jgi:signal transduction histidine kinase